MQAVRDKYLDVYRSLKLARDGDVSWSPSFTPTPAHLTAQDHTKFVDAFYHATFHDLPHFAGRHG